MKKAEQYIQSEYGRHASILPDWNDICNADITKLGEISWHIKEKRPLRGEEKAG